MRTLLRVLLRQYRFEALSILVLCGAAFIAGVVVRERLADVVPTRDCYLIFAAGHETGPGCPDLTIYLQRNETEAGPFMAAMSVLPLVVGVLAGSVLVSREIEHRTAQFAWSLRPARTRWLLERVLPTLVFVAIVLIPAAVIAERVETLRQPSVDPVNSFIDFGLFGAPVVARAIATTSVAVLVGLVLGRQLPAVIVSAGAAAGLLVLLGATMPYGEPGVFASLDRYQSVGGSGFVQDYFMEQGFVGADGRLLTYEQAAANAPQDVDVTQWVDSEFEEVDHIIPGTQASSVTAREVAISAGIGVTSISIAAVVVKRRRPY